MTTDPTNILEAWGPQGPDGPQFPLGPDLTRPVPVPTDGNTAYRVPEPPLLAENLSAKHIGAKVTITAPGVAYTGRIEDISFNVDRMYGPNEATSVRVEFDRATIAFPLGATVEVHS